MKVTIVLGILLSPYFNAESTAQFSYFQGDPRSQGLSHAGVMLADHWSGLENPAGLADLRKTTFGTCYSNNYLVSQLGTGAASCGLVTPVGNYGISILSFGTSSFRQSMVSLCYGRNLGKKLRAGMGIHYLRIWQAAGYGNLYTVIPSLGLQVIPVERITFGFHVYNPARQEYIPSGYLEIPAGWQAGVGMNFGKEILLCIQAEKNRNEHLVAYGGFEIMLHDKIPVRFGLTSGIQIELSFGIGFRSHRFQVDLAATRHPVLGFSPAIGLACAI